MAYYFWLDCENLLAQQDWEWAVNQCHLCPRDVSFRAFFWDISIVKCASVKKKLALHTLGNPVRLKLVGVYEYTRLPQSFDAGLNMVYTFPLHSEDACFLTSVKRAKDKKNILINRHYNVPRGPVWHMASVTTDSQPQSLRHFGPTAFSITSIEATDLGNSFRRFILFSSSKV